MKKKLLLIALSLVVVATLLLFGGCNSGVVEGNNKYKHWFIEESPITGKYYEIFQYGGYTGMSEVTEQEYNKYLEMIEEK